MLKKLITLAIVATVTKVVLDKFNGEQEADLWSEATDTVAANR